MLPVVQLGLRAVRAESARLKKNIGARSANLQKKNIQTEAMGDFSHLMASANPKNVREARSQLVELRRLDKNKGLRAATAQRQQELQIARARRKTTAKELMRDKRYLPNEQDVDELYTSLRNSLRGKTNRIKADEELQGTYATRIFDEFLETMVKNPTRRQKAAYTRKLMEIQEYQGIDLEGARIQHNRGVEAFGPQYAEWTSYQRGHAWQGFNRFVAKLGAGYGSDRVMAMFRDVVSQGHSFLEFVFEKDADGDDTETIIQAVVSLDPDEVTAQSARARFDAEQLANIKAKSVHPPARLGARATKF